ncbi:MAG: carboxypeptidase-like regulatory domain-containing protein [Bacteroidales bacterium]|nr:carboxypeptidase-like regulatory domain-containing protein [Bacteroidales bacterium]
MKGKDKNKKSTLSEFIRYTRGEMTSREENAFQRKLQKDPFAEEATEGFSEISHQEADKDLERLGKRLKNRIRGRNRIIYYRIAASVAVLMIISSVFLIIQRYKPVRQLSETIVTPSASEKTDAITLTEPLVAESKSETAVPEMEAEQEITDSLADTTISAETIIAAFADTTQVLAIAEKKDTGILITADQIAAPAAKFRMQEIPDLNVRGKILSSDDKQPIAGVNVVVKGTYTGAITDIGGNFNITLPNETNRTLVANYIGMERKEFQAVSGSVMQVELDPSEMALSEVVVVGYGTAKRAEAEQTDYQSPQPVTGRSNFNRYIEENIKRPQTLPQGERAVAVIRFVVRTTGTIDSLKVVSSPGDEFATEAIRLIREGPAWKPGEENGVPIDDEVRVRIVFK